jgi:hypothetical protein
MSYQRLVATLSLGQLRGWGGVQLTKERMMSPDEYYELNNVHIDEQVDNDCGFDEERMGDEDMPSDYGYDHEGLYGSEW